jgi:hypothetical protein
MNPTSLFGSRFVWAQTAIFSAEPCSKNAGKSSIVLKIMACEKNIPTSRNPNQNSATLWQDFSYKSAPANRKKGSIQTVIRTSRGLDSFLYEAAQNFKVFSNIQN